MSPRQLTDSQQINPIQSNNMRFTNCLAVAVALAATAASAAPIIVSKDTFTATLDEGHLNHEAMEKRWANPSPSDGAKKRSIPRPPLNRVKRAEASEKSPGNFYENPSDHGGRSDTRIRRRAWHGPGSAHCIDKTRGCYSEE